MTENMLKKLEEHVQCSICLDTYMNPKVLQCHHVYCRNCLFKILVGKHGQPLTYLECPICRVRSQLPSCDVDELQSAFHMTGVLEIRNEFGKVEDTTLSLKSLPTSLEEPVSDFSKPSVCFCSDHEREEVKLYCDVCAVTICFLCAISGGKHHTHQYRILREAYKKYEKGIEASMTSLDDGITCIAKLLDQVDAGSINVREREAALQNEIGEKFRELHDILNARQTELVGDLQEIVHRKLKMLSAHRDELETLQVKASRCKDVARENLATKNEAAVLKMKTKIAEQVQEVSSILLPHGLKFEMTTADMVFKSSPELSKVCQKFGEFIASRSPDPLKCYVTGSWDVAEVGQKALIRLHIADSNGEPCSEDAQCSCACEVLTEELEVCATRSCPGNVERIGLSEYELSYTPTSFGSSEIHVKVNRGHVKGSPFPITVTKKKREARVPTLKDVNGLGIAICPRSQAVVVTNTCVSIYNCNGEHVLSFGKPGFGRGDFNKPYGLVIDDKGNIVVADHFNGRIQKFNMEGVFIASAGSKEIGPLKFDHPYDIAFNPNSKKLYVIDNTCVQILKTDLSYIACFGKHGCKVGEFSTPHGIACDKFGNIFVADSGNHRIQVFTSSGKFLKFFGRHGSREGELGFPVAIAIGNKGLVYISESENHRVSVFTISGKFLSFLKNETDRTFCRFISPRGIAIDHSGVTYICDNKCIMKV